MALLTEHFGHAGLAGRGTCDDRMGCIDFEGIYKVTI